MAITIQRVVIKTGEDIQNHRFIGSPTVRLNGLDIDPNMRDIERFGMG